MKKTGAAKKKTGRRGRAKKVGPYNRDEWIAEQKEKNHNETIFEQKIDAAMEVSYGKQHRVTDFFGVVNLRDDCNIGEIKKQSLKKKNDSSSLIEKWQTVANYKYFLFMLVILSWR